MESWQALLISFTMLCSFVDVCCNESRRLLVMYLSRKNKHYHGHFPDFCDIPSVGRSYTAIGHYNERNLHQMLCPLDLSKVGETQKKDQPLYDTSLREGHPNHPFPFPNLFLCRTYWAWRTHRHYIDIIKAWSCCCQLPGIPALPVLAVHRLPI
jgi:hypothetical protein